AGSVIKEAITPKGSDKAAEAPAEEAAPAASEESAEA
ncbi:MAG: 30S ribosomal protein S16, partial [Brevibacterium aurantiacum]